MNINVGCQLDSLRSYKCHPSCSNQTQRTQPVVCSEYEDVQLFCNEDADSEGMKAQLINANYIEGEDLCCCPDLELVLTIVFSVLGGVILAFGVAFGAFVYRRKYAPKLAYS